MSWLLRSMSFSALLLLALAFGFLTGLAAELQIILPVLLIVTVGYATRFATNKRTHHAVRDVHRVYLSATVVVAGCYLLAHLLATMLAHQPPPREAATATAAALSLLFIGQFCRGYRTAAPLPALYLLALLLPAQPPAAAVWTLCTASVAAIGFRRRLRP